MISVIIPAYKEPEALDLCLQSAIEGQIHNNQIIVVVDGYYDLNKEVLEKYKDKIDILDLGENQGLCRATNLGVYNASNELILIVNDDNVFPSNWDTYLTIKHNEPRRNRLACTKAHWESAADLCSNQGPSSLPTAPGSSTLRSAWSGLLSQGRSHTLLLLWGAHRAGGTSQDQAPDGPFQRRFREVPWCLHRHSGVVHSSSLIRPYPQPYRQVCLPQPRLQIRSYRLIVLSSL